MAALNLSKQVAKWVLAASAIQTTVLISLIRFCINLVIELDQSLC